ncbi:sensor histidine kinase [Cylindrospermum sp. FACHB-282]|uniref:sensor histidine kinase n=1 Tax=Cylindrospermum sp. FACHB-282 TaxID=2692794 RepID=UPI001683C543|nr:GAF domain-containing protein [Cylindrospermum sp. FACHB-282]MBD2384895.1 GAF domain-containing protein [Cylindrospermum sp. FACHB-282]
MTINPVESILELKQPAPPQILFGTEVDKKSSSEQFLLSMYDSVQASIFVVDVLDDGDFRYLALNPTHERWLGIRSDELRGKKPEDILSAVDAARVRQHYADCVRFGKTISYEQCLQFQGNTTWWSTTLTPLRDADSRIYRLIGTSSNITPSKQAEQALGWQVERERLLEAVAHRIRQAEDLETILQQTVKEVRQLLECDRILIYRLQPDSGGIIIAESTITANGQLLGQNINDPCFSSTHRKRYKRGCIQVVEDIYAAGLHPCHRDFLASLQVRANLIVPILVQQELWGLLIAQHCCKPHQWQQPEIDLLKQLATQIGIAAQQAELHQQVKYLQAQLDLQKQQLQQTQNFQGLIRRITEQIRDNLDETKVLKTVAAELSHLLKLERCQIEFYSTCHTSATVICEYTTNLPHCQGLTRQIADFPEVYQPLLHKQILQSWEIVPEWHSNLQVVTQMACPIFDNQGILGNIWLIRPTQGAFDELEIALAQQIADECAIAIRQSQLYTQTKAQQQEITNRERLKNEFLRTLSQELRTPVTNISLAAQTLESVLTPNGKIDPELISQLLQILHNECGRESKLIKDLLTLTYLKTEPEPPTLIAIDLQTWLPPIVESFRDLASCQRQKLELKIEAELPPLETDITDLERIVSELLHHACKCTPEGEEITVSAYLTADSVQLSLSNSGVEIPSNELSQIFQPFYRITKNAPWKSSDTGLELTLVKTMVKHLGGSIQAESAAGQITFTIKFPL